ncbi:uncharacterized protein DUF3306 [Litoreibacter meonggei]|uniref:Uncharacterized protein DUF3306 n=1 Tax=Litoreibacter meonggei TaxID=1049199 RepID=A0A497WTD1_9RHOB|nr:DUF3306 domain-containing protein [Litoreibacter meonggei]RLJ59919.1 uncharacterized protein DUF3306 [Litoreibacter meonggei]
MSAEQSFWSKRRAGVAAEAEAEQAAVDAQALAAEHAALEEKTDAELLAELDLPDPDTLKMGDDFSAFMAKAVPDRIRRRALRTLWRSNPVLANVDMLVDYGEDFTDRATVVENMQTAYQVGKGMLKHVEEMARQTEARENPPEPEEIEEEVEEEPVLVAAAEDEGDEAEDVADLDQGQGEEAYAATTPRRMKFRLEESAA